MLVADQLQKIIFVDVNYLFLFTTVCRPITNKNLL